MLLHFGQQMRCVRRRDPLRREMAADVQVSWIFFLLDGLMMAARVLQRLLLGAALFVQHSIARFVLFPHFRDVPVDHRDGGFMGRQFLACRATRFGRAEPGTSDLGSFLGQTNAPRADAGHLGVEIVRRWGLRLKLRQLLQQIAVRGVVLL